MCVSDSVCVFMCMCRFIVCTGSRPVVRCGGKAIRSCISS